MRGARAAGALAALLLAACGGSGSAPEPVTLRFWAMGREGEMVQRLVPAFERENPGIRVEVQQIPWSAAHEKLLTAYVGESTPDLAQLGNTWIPEFAALNALAPLDSALAAAPRDVPRDAYFAGVWDTNVVDGATYGLPWYVDTRVVFYRADLLRAAGYDSLPQTWAGWRDAMRALKARMGPRQYPILLPVNEWQPSVILGLQAGAPLLRDDGRYGHFRDPRFAEAFGFYVSLFREGLAPAVSNTEISNLYQEFARGNVAMYVTGPWNLGEFRARLPAEAQDDWATAPVPGPDGPGLSVAGGASLVVFRASRHPREAWRLAAYLSRPDVQAEFYRLTGDLPARRDAWDAAGLSTDRQAAAFLQQLERVAPTPKVPEWEQIATRVMERGEAAVRGAATPEAALRALDGDVDALLEKRRWLLDRRREP